MPFLRRQSSQESSNGRSERKKDVHCSFVMNISREDYMLEEEVSYNLCHSKVFEEVYIYIYIYIYVCVSCAAKCV